MIGRTASCVLVVCNEVMAGMILLRLPPKYLQLPLLRTIKSESYNVETMFGAIKDTTVSQINIFIQ